MRLHALAQALRDTSERFGGIKHYLEAAGQVDRAASAFARNQDMDSLAALNGAVARATRYKMETEMEKGPVAV